MSECINRRCNGKRWYLDGDGKVVECLDCKYRNEVEKTPGLNKPFQEIYDQAKEVESRKRILKETEKEEDKRILEKVEKIKRLSKKDRDDWILYNKLKIKFLYLGT